jgi:hypothetical protein
VTIFPYPGNTTLNIPFIPKYLLLSGAVRMGSNLKYTLYEKVRTKEGGIERASDIFPSFSAKATEYTGYKNITINILIKNSVLFI